MVMTFDATGEAVVREALGLLCREDNGRVDELIHPEFRDHTRPALERGAESFRSMRSALYQAFADVELIPRDVIVGFDGSVTVRLRFRGLHVGPYAGIEPCGQAVEIDEIHIWRLVDGRIIEHWAQRDELQALRQMVAHAPRPNRNETGG